MSIPLVGTDRGVKQEDGTYVCVRCQRCVLRAKNVQAGPVGEMPAQTVTVLWCPECDEEPQDPKVDYR